MPGVMPRTRRRGTGGRFDEGGGRTDGRFSLHPENPILESRMHANVPVRLCVQERLMGPAGHLFTTRTTCCYSLRLSWEATRGRLGHGGALGNTLLQTPAHCGPGTGRLLPPTRWWPHTGSL